MPLNFFTFNNEDFICTKCGWKGKGSELSTKEFSEIHLICNVGCPSCNENMGFWQTTLIEDVKKWKKENPGVKTGWKDLDID